ncbi:hypothetical protein ACJBU6_11157 [Exserohilum turcicum]
MKLPADMFLVSISTIPTEGNQISVSQVELLDICNNFIVHDSELDTFRFAHLSVREFLEERSDSKLFRELGWETDADPSKIKSIGFYTDVYWAVHCKFAGDLRKAGTLKAALRHMLLGMSWEDHEKFLELLRQPPFPVAVFVIYAFGFEELGQELSVSEALTIPYTNKRGKSIVQVAAKYRSYSLVSHLIVQKEFKAVHACDMLVAADTEYREEVTRHLISRWTADQQSREEWLVTILRIGSVEIAETFLDSLRDISVTQEMANAAVANDRSSTAMMALLLRRREKAFEITELIKVALRSRGTPVTLLKLLLDQQNANIIITKEMVESAIVYGDERVEKLKLLLSQQNTKIAVTKEMVELAIAQKNQSGGLVEFLLNQWDEDIPITKEMIKGTETPGSGSSPLIKPTMSRRSKDVLLEALAITAIVRHSGKEAVKSAIDKFGAHSVITEENMDIVLEDEKRAQELLPLFLQVREDVCDWLLQRKHSHFRTERVGKSRCRIRFETSDWMYIKFGDTG